MTSEVDRVYYYHLLCDTGVPVGYTTKSGSRFSVSITLACSERVSWWENFFPLQSLLVSHERRRLATGAVSDWRSYGPWNPAPSAPDQHADARRSRVRCNDQQPHEVRVHRRQRLRESVGHQPTRISAPRQSAGLPPARELHPVRQATSGRAHPHRRGGGEQPQHLGPGRSDALHQSRAELERAGLLCPGHQSRLQTLFQLLLRW